MPVHFWAGLSAAALAYGARGRCSSLLAPSVCHGARTRRSVALTFDDGPTPSTIPLLKILASYGVKATFFQCGIHVRRAPEIARAVHAAGHEIGNHTFTHPLLALRSPAFIHDELFRTQETIAAATGSQPTLFRPPYGVRWFGLGAAQRRLDLLGVMWTVIGRDWKLPAKGVADRVLLAASSGAILCLHDGREIAANPDVGVTLEAVKRIVPSLLEMGFRFETASQLLCPTK